MACASGDPIQIEFSSSNATTAASLSLRDAGGSLHTLNGNERLILQTVNINAASGVGTVTIFDDANANGTPDAGERLLVVGEGFNNIPLIGTDGGSAAGKGRVPQVISTGAGAVSITGTAAIVKG